MTDNKTIRAGCTCQRPTAALFMAHHPAATAIRILIAMRSRACPCAESGWLQGCADSCLRIFDLSCLVQFPDINSIESTRLADAERGRTFSRSMRRQAHRMSCLEVMGGEEVTVQFLEPTQHYRQTKHGNGRNVVHGVDFDLLGRHVASGCSDGKLRCVDKCTHNYVHMDAQKHVAKHVWGHVSYIHMSVHMSTCVYTCPYTCS